MRKNPILLYCIALIVGLFGLVQIKMHVHNLDKQIKTLHEAKSSLSNEIKVLNAEWTYLNRAERLEVLAKKYLRTVEAKTVYSIDEFGANRKPTVQLSKKPKLPISKVNWRYKSRESVLSNVKGLKNIGNHGIIKVKGH